MVELLKVILKNCEISLGRDVHGFWLTARGPIPVLATLLIAIGLTIRFIVSS